MGKYRRSSQKEKTDQSQTASRRNETESEKQPASVAVPGLLTAPADSAPVPAGCPAGAVPTWQEGDPVRRRFAGGDGGRPATLPAGRAEAWAEGPGGPGRPERLQQAVPAQPAPLRQDEGNSGGTVTSSELLQRLRQTQAFRRRRVAMETARCASGADGRAGRASAHAQWGPQTLRQGRASWPGGGRCGVCADDSEVAAGARGRMWGESSVHI